MAKKKKPSFYDNLDHWSWPLPFNDNETLDLFLDKFMGTNKNVDNDERRKFIGELRMSLSLSHIEKRVVISAFPTLSRFQIDELLKTWVSERHKFIELEVEHPNDIVILIARQEFAWAIVLNESLGAESYASKYVFNSSTRLPIDSLLRNINHFSDVLSEEKKYNITIAMISDIFSRQPEIGAGDRSWLINAGFYALARSKKVNSPEEMITHQIGKEIDNISDEGNDNSRRKHDRSKAFLRFCSISYMMDIYGLNNIEENGKKLCIHYKSINKDSSDMSSTMSTYFILKGDGKSALKAAEISLRRYNSDFSFKNTHLLQLAENGNAHEPFNTNVLRNSIRYAILLHRFDGQNYRFNRFIEEYFAGTIEHFDKWRYEKSVDNLWFFIAIYFFTGKNGLKNNTGVKRVLDSRGKDHEKFLFRLAFSRPVRGGELDGLQEAMNSIDAKTSLITFCLIVRAISTSRLPFKEDRIYVCDILKKSYLDTVREKEWILNEEAWIFDAEHKSAKNLLESPIFRRIMDIDDKATR